MFFRRSSLPLFPRRRQQKTRQRRGANAMALPRTAAFISASKTRFWNTTCDTPSLRLFSRNPRGIGATYCKTKTRSTKSVSSTTTKFTAAAATTVAERRKRTKREREEKEATKVSKSAEKTREILCISLHATMRGKLVGPRPGLHLQNPGPMILRMVGTTTAIAVAAARYFTTTTTGLLLCPLVPFDRVTRITISVVEELGIRWSSSRGARTVRSNSGIFFDQKNQYPPSQYARTSMKKDKANLRFAILPLSIRWHGARTASR
mmetsp:Transcript_9442/g.23174  ORF Transcript_9442/g.23174 Transcript_9442/m.23174 type:complete len:263 (+) Transcript_9442:357-1145(+)